MEREGASGAFCAPRSHWGATIPRLTTADVALAGLLLVTLVLPSCIGDNAESSDQGSTASTADEVSSDTSTPPTEPTTAGTSPPPEDAATAWVAMWDGASLLVTDPEAAQEAPSVNLG